MFGTPVRLKVVVCSCGCGERLEHRGDCVMFVSGTKRIEVNATYGSRINVKGEGPVLEPHLKDIADKWLSDLRWSQTCPICQWMMQIWTPDYKTWYVTCRHDGCRASMYSASGPTVREAYAQFCHEAPYLARQRMRDPVVLDGSMWMENTAPGDDWRIELELWGIDPGSGATMYLGKLPEDYELNPNEDALALSEMLEFSVLNEFGTVLYAFGIDYRDTPAPQTVEDDDPLAEDPETEDFLQELVDAGEIEVEDAEARADFEVQADMAEDDDVDETVNPADGFPW